MSEIIRCVIITFNRFDLMKQVVNAVRNQSRKLDEIIVINNGSTDGSTEWLNEQSDLTVITQGNVGSSGGQYTGFKYAFEKGFDWLWTMDDDVAPVADCLENMLKLKDRYKIIAPLRYSLNGEPFENDSVKINLTNPFKSIWAKVLSKSDIKGDALEIDMFTFEGPMFHYDVLKEIGLPNKHYFIYADDSDFSLRARKAGFKIALATKARLNRYLEFLDPRHVFNWKNYYLLRNVIALDVLHAPIHTKIIRPFGYFTRHLLRSKNFEQVKINCKGFWHGINFNRRYK